MTIDDVAAEAVEDLQTLLRMRTVNPPGDEEPAINFIRERLTSAGIECVVHESEGRPNLVARIKGDGTGGGPLLLAGHVDVVPVEEESWDHDPFGGEIHDGYLYGRGAVDMKDMVTMCMHVAMLAHRSDTPPNRDIIFAAVSDEEQGCTHGSRFLVEQHPELVTADYMIGEVGGFPQDVNGVRYYLIQVGEKGKARIRLTARGKPGHGSIPHGDMAMVKLAKAIQTLGTTRLPMHRTQLVDDFIRGLAASQKGLAKRLLPFVLKPRFSNLVLDKVLPDRAVAETFAASLSNTVSPTLLEGSAAVNVIPGVVSVTLDGRLIPGQTADDLVSELRAILDEDIEYEVLNWHEGRENAGNDPLLDLMKETLVRHDPSGIPLCYLLPGFTDAAWFGKLGARCYGFSPLRWPVEDGLKFKDLFHGHNERIHVDGFKWGLGVLWDVVATFTGMG